MMDLLPSPSSLLFIAEPLCYYKEGSKSSTYLSLGRRAIQRLPLVNCLLAVSLYILYSDFMNWVCLLPHWLVFVLKSVYEKKMVSPLSVVCLDNMLKLNTMSAYDRYSKNTVVPKVWKSKPHLLLHLPEVEHSLPWFFYIYYQFSKAFLKP